ncbi:MULTISPECIES: EscU/YscU/HrcU family type III secretion system export apparatus switch protein [unclassified Caballeronia]|uniref:EscU/YscU/HrcU family type III secretion system export apparatus switch protein n=1 Tax=unclassified Caballeronia TaxID=2646786 RepID=UPI00202845FB|nr:MULTISPECIES: EscU/YscU/HrcU family type III secretion system export apparatus switch protein [unclassified Caballeronia]
MSTEKTEQPTPKRLKDARRDGNVPYSPDFTGFVTLAAFCGVLAGARDFLQEWFRSIVMIALSFVKGDHADSAIKQAVSALTMDAILVTGIFASVAIISSLFVSFAQTGLAVSIKKVSPKLESVSPASGLKKMFGLSALSNFGLMLVKAVAMSLLMFFAIQQVMPWIFRSAYQVLPEISFNLWSSFVRVLLFAVVFVAIIGFIDLKIKRWIHIRGLRMSKDEIKREYKEQEGNQDVKRERRKQGKEIVLSAPRKIGLADAVIVNPTHYAVAIRYNLAEHDLPYILLKGKDEEALKIKRTARELNVPVIGNPTIARALYKVEENAPIPEELFESVAAILRWVNSVAKTNLSAAHGE